MLSIVIPTLNRPDSLVKLVESLERQIMDALEFEILAVYNDPSEALKTPLKKHPKLQVLCSAHPGVNYARNKGAQAAMGDVVLFIDDDCVVEDPYFLQKHVDYHQNFPETVALGGPYQIPPSASLWDRIYQKNNQNWLEANRVSETQTFALLGGNTSYKSFIFKNGFQFTEEITYGGSETPLNTLLALKYGPLGYFSDLTITHQTSLNGFDLCRKAYHQGKGAAVQTKLYGHQLRQSAEIASTETGFVRWGLEMYGFLFMTSYKSHLLHKKIFVVFAQELWTRLVLKKKENLIRRYEIAQQKYTGHARANFIKVYWWQHSYIRHPFCMFLKKTYWFIYTLASQLTLFFKKMYWTFFYDLFCRASGFLITLLEPLPVHSESHFLQRVQQRFLHISRKMAWLCLKTVRLR